MPETESEITRLNRATQDLAREMEQLREQVIDAGFADVASLVLRGINRLRESSFRVVVIGEFSRGKSLFVNALLGQDLLPSGLRPTTAVVTRIVYGNPEESLVRYFDGRSAPLSASQLKELKAKESSADAGVAGTDGANGASGIALEQVASLDVSVKSDLLRNRVQIIDTPGLNDINRLREDVTLRYLPEADAAIFLIHAQAPLNETERQFLETRVFGQHLGRVFFVINKADTLRPPYNAADLGKAKGRLAELLGARFDESRVFAVGSKPALTAALAGDAELLNRSGMPSFRQALSDFLARDRGRVTLERALHDLDLAVESLRTSARFEREAGRLTADEVRRRTADAEERLAQLRARLESTKRRWVEEVTKIQGVIAGLAHADLTAAVGRLLRDADGRSAADFLSNAADIEELGHGALRTVVADVAHRAGAAGLEALQQRASPILREAGDTLRSDFESLSSATYPTGIVAPALHVPTVHQTGHFSMSWGFVGLLAGSLFFGPLGTVAAALASSFLGGTATMVGRKAKADVMERLARHGEMAVSEIPAKVSEGLGAVAEDLWRSGTEGMLSQARALETSIVRLKRDEESTAAEVHRKADELVRVLARAESVKSSGRALLGD